MKEQADTVEVLIVGAGPTGLVAAIDLARRKIPFRIIDRAARPARESRAAAVWPRTIEVLEKLDVSEALLKQGNALKGIRAYSGESPLFDADIKSVDSAYPFVLVIPQNETETILIDRLKDLGVTVERSVELLNLTQEPELVRATVSRGARGREVIRARWLLGCDGAHSLVRKAAGVAFPGEPYLPSFALADVDVEWKRPADQGTAFFGPHGPIAFLPFRGGKRYRIIAQLSSVRVGEHGVAEEMGLSDFEEILQDGLPPEVLSQFRLSNPQWIARFNIHHRCAPHFRSNRVFLVGDAAHIHSPVGGQGMNTGLQDALNLTWKLALVIQEAATPSILDTYQTERLPVAAGIVRGTDIATRLVTVSSSWIQVVRNLALKRISRWQWLRDRFADAAAELTVHYEANALVGASRKPARRALAPGRRAPDGELRVGSSRTRLFAKLRACEHAFLLFSGAADRRGSEPLSHLAAELVRRFGAWAEVIVIASGEGMEKMPGLTVGLDMSGELHRKYGVEQPAVFWIRPDGYVGYRSEPVELDACEAFLSTSFDLRKLPRRTTRTGARPKTAARAATSRSRPRTRAAK